MDETLLRGLVPQVIGVLVRRGNDFAAAEDAVQEALLEALRSWPDHPPRDARAWLLGVATRRLIDAAWSDAARRVRVSECTASRHLARPRRATTPSCCSSGAAILG